MKKDKGYLWNKTRWYSFCSKHMFFDDECKMCQGGSWENVWKSNIGSFINQIQFRIVKFFKIPNKWGL